MPASSASAVPSGYARWRGFPTPSANRSWRMQEMAEACKRLIKNCIICWNYLYLSQKLAEIDDPAKRKELLQAMAHGSAAAWGHLNLLGEYDFSEDKLQDSVGIKPPKLTD
jgi:hypothetical protein